MRKSEYDKAKENTKLDIFAHLNLNIRNPDFNCKCQNSESPAYCVQCKRSVCGKCGLADHEKHNPIDKSKFELTVENIEKDFEPACNFLESESIFKDYTPVKEQLIKQIDKSIQSLMDEVNKYKEKKYRDINRKFDTFDKQIKTIKENLEFTKKGTLKFAEKNKNFFNLNLYNNPEIQHGNRDMLNTVFFLGYDLLSLVKVKSYLIEDLLKKIITQVNLFNNDQEVEFKEVLARIKEALFPPEMEDSQNLNNYELDSPTYLFYTNCKKLEEANCKDINNRLTSYTDKIENFKKTIYGILGKGGSLKELEREVSAFENNTQTGADNLFSKRKHAVLNMDGNENDKIYLTNKLEDSHFVPHLMKKDDVCLNHSLIDKFFSFIVCQLYGEKFRMHTKELQSSHADLMIKVDEFEGDSAKVIEGTNEIWFTEKKTKKINKVPINLTKNPHGYTKFPLGCRTLLIGKKMYITGGVNESGEFPNVLIFDRKTNKIKRIMDMIEPRSYHSIFYSQTFSTIFIIGGVNRNSVEVFDPVTNRWQYLPPLTFPRANPYFHMDESRGLMYVMFGQDGQTINENSYSEVIEYLDLTRIKDGWFFFPYNNRANIHLKSYLNIVPINHELLLIMGGVTARKSTKTLSVLDFTKKAICKIDKKTMEVIRLEAKKSKKLNYIISSMSLNSK